MGFSDRVVTRHAQNHSEPGLKVGLREPSLREDARGPFLRVQTKSAAGMRDHPGFTGE